MDSKTAIGFIERIETANAIIAAIYEEMRSRADYLSSQDNDIRQIVALRADARQADEDAKMYLGAFDGE